MLRLKASATAAWLLLALNNLLAGYPDSLKQIQKNKARILDTSYRSMGQLGLVHKMFAQNYNVVKRVCSGLRVGLIKDTRLQCLHCLFCLTESNVVSFSTFIVKFAKARYLFTAGFDLS